MVGGLLISFMVCACENTSHARNVPCQLHIEELRIRVTATCRDHTFRRALTLAATRSCPHLSCALHRYLYNAAFFLGAAAGFLLLPLPKHSSFSARIQRGLRPPPSSRAGAENNQLVTPTTCTANLCEKHKLAAPCSLSKHG